MVPTLPDPPGAPSALAPAGRDIVLFDGDCALCHATVRFFLRRDPDGRRFVFAPLGGATFGKILPPDHPATLVDSVVVWTADGRLLIRSEAVTYLLVRVGGQWAAMGRGLAALPSPLTDRTYVLVARIRRRLFGRPPDWCPVPRGPDRSRFLP